MDNYPSWELLLCWVSVVESNSISEASTRLRISQAAVSQRVKLLEGVMQVPLLDRASRPALPTAAGLRLYEDANELLRKASQLTENVRNVSRAKRLNVRIGCVDSFAATLGPLLIKGLSGVSQTILLWSGIAPALNAQMDSRQLDLAVTTEASTNRPGVVRHFLFSEPYLAVVPRHGGSKEFESVGDLAARLPFVRYSSRSVIGRHIDSYLRSVDVNLERTYEFDASDPLFSLVSSDLGWALTTPLCLWQSRHFVPDMRVIPLAALGTDEMPWRPLYRNFYLLSRTDEMGRLPSEIRNMVKEIARRQLSRDIAAAIGMPQEAIFQFDEAI